MAVLLKVAAFFGICTALAAVLIAWYMTENFDPETVRGKKVVICGASTGIGEELAYQYAKLGAQLLLVARREEVLKKVVARCRELGAQSANYVVADLSSLEAAKNLAAVSSTTCLVPPSFELTIGGEWGIPFYRNPTPPPLYPSPWKSRFRQWGTPQFLLLAPLKIVSERLKTLSASVKEYSNPRQALLWVMHQSIPPVPIPLRATPLGFFTGTLSCGWGICAPLGDFPPPPPRIWYMWFQNRQKPRP